MALAFAVPLAAQFVLWHRGAIVGFDDSYYYYLIADNFVRLGRLTFDGLTLTNGFHPLWLALLVVLHAILPGAALEPLGQVAGYLLAVASVTVLWRAYRATPLRLGFALAFCWLYWYGATWAGTSALFFFIGMETGLCLFFLSLLSVALLRWDVLRPQTLALSAALEIGLILTGTVLARLDMAFLLPLIGLGMLPGLIRSRFRGFGKVLILLGIPGVVLLIYMAWSQIVFGTPMPVSGQAKSLGGPFFSFYPFERLMGVGFDARVPMFAAPVVVVCAVAVAVMSPNHRLRTALLLVLGVLLLQLVYLVIFSSWLLWGYYYSLVFILCALALPPPLAFLAGKLPGRLQAWLPALAGAAMVLLGAYVNRGVFAGKIVHDWETDMHAVTDELKGLLPTDAKLAMGDRAGGFAYFLGKPVFQLEGLVNDTSYLADLKAGRVDARYLLDRGVGYYVHSGYRQSELGPGNCHALLEPRLGGGPKANIKVCDENLVYSHKFADDSLIGVWKLMP